MSLAAIHQSHPRHLVTCFQFFGHTSDFHHLWQERIHSPLCLPLNAGQVIVRSASFHQYHPQLWLMFPEIAAMEITVLTVKFLCRWVLVQYQIREVQEKLKAVFEEENG